MRWFRPRPFAFGAFMGSGVILATLGHMMFALIALCGAIVISVSDIVGINEDIRAARRRHKAFDARLEALRKTWEEE